MARKKAEPVVDTEETAADTTAPEPIPVETEKPEGPCATVRRIATEMRAANPATTRKQIVDACVAAGINLHTSKTQYQKWLKSQ